MELVINKNQIAEAILEGIKVRGNGGRCGCGRAYVSLGKVDRKVLRAYQDGAKLAGVRYLPEAYGAGKRCLYIGYDNADGVALAQAEAIAKNLQALGLPAFDEAVAD